MGSHEHGTAESARSDTGAPGHDRPRETGEAPASSPALPTAPPAAPGPSPTPGPGGAQGPAYLNSALVAHPPLTSAAKARRFGTWYLAEQHLRGMKGYLDIVIAYSVGNPLVYLFAMGIGLASLVDSNNAGGAFGGASYLQFIAPALLASAAMMTAAGEFTYAVMSGFKWWKTYYGPLATPVTPEQICQGHALAVTLRIVAQSAVYLVIVLFFGAATSGWAWATILTSSLAGVAFGLPLMAYSATVTVEKGQFALVQRFIVMPLFLFSGTLFPLSTLPWFLQWIGWISPVWHATELGRVLSYGHAEPGWLSAVHVIYLLVLAGGGLVLARRVYARRLEG